MRKILLLIVLMAGLMLSAWAISIYDVQFTTLPGSDGTYPSRFVGKSLSLEGVVTATNYRNGGYFISEKLNGPWRGILILDRDSQVQAGDWVRVNGTVSEYYGMTCLQDISQTRVLSSNNLLPTPLMLTSGQLAGSEEAEAYEAVYVRLMNVMPTQSKSNRNKLMVTDGSGPCVVQKDLFNIKLPAGSTPSQYASITGVVVYSFSEFALGPISGQDMIINQPKFIQNRSWGKIKSIYK